MSNEQKKIIKAIYVGDPHATVLEPTPPGTAIREPPLSERDHSFGSITAGSYGACTDIRPGSIVVWAPLDKMKP